MTVQQPYKRVGERVVDWHELASLPVGSVVMARHAKHRDLWPWVKTDDTELMDGFGDRLRHAWACVAYTQDRTAATLFAESSAVVVIWRGGDLIDGGEL